jgi:hypothetical protein
MVFTSRVANAHQTDKITLQNGSGIICYIGFDVKRTYKKITPNNVIYSGSCVQVPVHSNAFSRVMKPLNNASRLKKGACGPPKGFDAKNVRLYVWNRRGLSIVVDKKGYVIGRLGCRKLSMTAKEDLNRILRGVEVSYVPFHPPLRKGPKIPPGKAIVCYPGFSISGLYISITKSDIFDSGYCAKVSKDDLDLKKAQEALALSKHLEVEQCSNKAGFNKNKVRVFILAHGRLPIWIDANGYAVGRLGCRRLSSGQRKKIGLLLGRIINSHPQFFPDTDDNRIP